MERKFDPKEFISSKINEIKDRIGRRRVLLSCSGGVCSNVLVTLFRKAGEETSIAPVFIDTGFMREKEVETVSETLSRAPLKLDLNVVDARKRFMKGIERYDTAVEKKMSFYDIFFSILSDLAEKEETEFIALGTNASSKIAMEQAHDPASSKRSSSALSTRVFEPLAGLNRNKVLQLAQVLELPPRLSELVPFPLMGLSIRAVGKINDEKLRVLRDATRVVEEELQYIKPTQYFAAVLENKDDDYEKIDRVRERISDLLAVGADQVELKIPQCRVAGLADHTRVYLRASAARVTLLKSKEIYEPDYDDLVNFPIELKERYKDFARCLYNVTRKPKNGKYIAVIRAVSTENFNEASVARLEWSKLYSIAERIMNECSKVSSVYYDVTQKPPATIEFE